MSKTTTALVVKEKAGKATLETVAIGELAPDEALVQIEAVGVCHTDLACIDGTLPAHFPCVFGHEGGGIVQQVGSGITNVKVGDKVLLSYAFCGECGPCKSNLAAYCIKFPLHNFGGQRPDGTSALSLNGEKCHSNFFGQSSFMRDAVVHKSSMVKVPADTDVSIYAPLGCGMQTGSGCIINTLKVKEGSTVAIFGVGAVGLAAVMGAKICKAGKIIAIDLHKSRLDLAKELGATDVLDGGDPNIVENVQKLSPPNGVNYAVDCTGVIKVVENMIKCLGTKGVAASVGAPPPGNPVNVDPFTHLLMGRSYIGCTEGDSVTSEYIPYLIEQHKKGNFPFDKLIKHYDAKDAEAAFQDSLSGKVIKAILKW